MDLLYRARKSRLRHSLRTQLNDVTEAPGSGAERFVPRGTLAPIWTAECLRELSRVERMRLSSSAINIIRRDYLQTISTLIYINWDEWPRFGELFLSHRDASGNPDRTDRKIRDYDRPTLTSDTFLGSGHGNLFFDARAIFFPVEIKENEDMRFENGWRLPFLPGRSEACGKGGFGKVTKEVIPAKHYISGSGPSSEETFVAPKVFKSWPDFRREWRNLQTLRDRESHHDRLVLPLATIVVEGQFNILFPLATMNLDEFLRGTQILPEQCDMGELLTQSAGVAAALAQLHTGLGFGVRGYHVDLKPANILVYMDTADSRVGTWKITDFGLSIFEFPDRDIRRGSFPEDPVTDTMTQLQKIRGTYLAPEICLGLGISRSSDVWSFGCILVRIFAFKLDDISGLVHLDELRGRNDDGVGYYPDGDYFTRGDPPVLNPHIERWIRSLPNRRTPYSSQFLHDCMVLLSLTLKIRKEDRPAALQVSEALINLRRIFLTALSTSLVPLPELPGSSHPVPPLSPAPGSSTHSVSNDPSPRGRPPSTAPSSPVASETHFDPSPGRPGLFNPTESLVNAIEQGNIDEVDTALAHRPGGDIESRDSNGNTPLGLAVQKGNPRIVHQLLQAKAGVNTRTGKGKTPLMIAARLGYEEIARMLVKAQADCELFCDEGFMCLHYATWRGRGGGLIRLLTSQLKRADIPRRGNNEETPLLTLIKNFHASESWDDKFRALVSAGADVNRPDNRGETPLIRAATEDFPGAVRLLLEHGADSQELTSLKLPLAVRRELQRVRPNETHRRQSVNSDRRRSLNLPWRRAMV